MDSETGMYYYGARYYDPRMSIFVSVDPLAEQTMEPYLYTGNNPIMFTDPTGMSKDDIRIKYTYQKDKEGNHVLDKKGNKIITGMNIEVTGKLINFSDNNVDMNKAVSDIKSHIESTYSADFGGLEVNTTVDLKVADSMGDVANSDHLFVLAEPGKNNNGTYGAVNNFGGKVAFIDADFFTGWYDTNFGNQGERTTSHELGHLLGLQHSSTHFTAKYFYKKKTPTFIDL